MGVRYQAVLWNGQKRTIDLVLALGVAGYLAVFLGVTKLVNPHVTIETLLIRGFGTAALLLLHVILVIGPLARLDARFLPLLYNRRHLGVTMFLLGLAHAAISIVQFHTLGDVNPLVSVLVSNPRVDSLGQFPFQPLGLVALGILFLMAATSHDFWLANLSAPVWKSLHMMVYFAWALLVLHVTLGVLQAETSPLLALLLGAGIVAVLGLHVLAARREAAVDAGDVGAGPRAAGPGAAGPGGRSRPDGDLASFVDVCSVDDIPESRAHVAVLSGERVAVFRWDGKVSAVSAVCQHQNGPLGEGKIVDGCITCPWHGYQYLPESGRSPEPFTERIPTFRVQVVGGRVWVDPRPNPPGTPVEPARV